MYTKGINHFEWRLLLDYSSEEALKIVAKYSELTFEKVMKTVNFLERRTISTLELISCSKDEMVSIFLEVPSKSNINFLEIGSISAIGKISSVPSSQISKTYAETREKDIFTLIEAGYKVVNETMFNHLSFLRKAQLN